LARTRVLPPLPYHGDPATNHDPARTPSARMLRRRIERYTAHFQRKSLVEVAAIAELVQAEQREAAQGGGGAVTWPRHGYALSPARTPPPEVLSPNPLLPPLPFFLSLHSLSQGLARSRDAPARIGPRNWVDLGLNPVFYHMSGMFSTRRTGSNLSTWAAHTPRRPRAGTAAASGVGPRKSCQETYRGQRSGQGCASLLRPPHGQVLAYRLFQEGARREP
jgi:hypothetical protein